MISSSDRRCRIQSLMLAAILILPGMVPAQAATRDPFIHFFSQSFGDLRDEAATAKAEGKLGVLVMFDDKDCPWCHKMKTTVLNQVEVQDYFHQYFRAVRVDSKGDQPLTDFDGKEMTEKDFAFKVHRVRATPVFIFFDTGGNVMLRYTGVTRDVREFKWLTEFVADGHYKTKKFTVYKQEKLAASRS